MRYTLDVEMIDSQILAVPHQELNFKRRGRGYTLNKYLVKIKYGFSRTLVETFPENLYILFHQLSNINFP